MIQLSQSICNVVVHVVFTTARRTPWISEAVEARVWSHLAACINATGSETIAVGGVDDHVHLVFALSPTVALSTLIGRAKGATSRFASTEIALSEFAWQRGYFAASVHTSDMARLLAYVQNQRQHHRERTLDAELARFTPRASSAPANDGDC